MLLLLVFGVLDDYLDVTIAAVWTVNHLCARPVQVAKNTKQLIYQRAQNVEEKYDGKRYDIEILLVH